MHPGRTERFELKGKHSPRPHVRVYWRHVGEIIGASRGKPTEYVFVMYTRDGTVHRYPIPAEELRLKGAET
jgi:hypothetical protein